MREEKKCLYLLEELKGRSKTKCMKRTCLDDPCEVWDDSLHGQREVRLGSGEGRQGEVKVYPRGR
jgi:hypothetical protein